MVLNFDEKLSCVRAWRRCQAAVATGAGLTLRCLLRRTRSNVTTQLSSTPTSGELGGSWALRVAASAFSESSYWQGVDPGEWQIVDDARIGGPCDAIASFSSVVDSRSGPTRSRAGSRRAIDDETVGARWLGRRVRLQIRSSPRSVATGFGCFRPTRPTPSSAPADVRLSAKSDVGPARRPPSDSGQLREVTLEGMSNSASSGHPSGQPLT
jgi:hypothetical protein